MSDTQTTACPSCGRTDRHSHRVMPRALLPERPLYPDQPKAYDLSIHVNPDAQAWVRFFREHNPQCNVSDELMLSWFANAMMAMHDYLNRSGPINGDHAQYLIDSERGDGVDNGKA